MLPPTSVGSPAFLSSSPIRVVVVVLPFDPVIPMSRPLRKRAASSISLMISTPAAAAFRNGSSASGTPGLATIRSAFSNNSVGCEPATTSTPLPRSAAATLSSLSGFASFTVTRAPRASRKSAAASPLRAAPTTRTFLPPTCMRHLSLSVERLKSANKIAAMRKRKTTFDSFQPSNSKWW